MVSELANEDVVVRSISGLGCNVEDEGVVRWPAAKDVGGLERCSAPRNTMNDVSSMRCNEFGSCEKKI